jgi:RNA polymerase sigma factor for flagellar operon FliA
MGKAAKAYQQSSHSSAKMEELLPLVRRIAGKMSTKLPRSVEVGDLIQAGCVGLAQAWSRFSLEGGASFESYASSRIRGAMLDWLRAEDLLPKSARKESKRIDAAIAKLRNQLGREPREEEIADELDISLEHFQSNIASFENSQILSLEDLGIENPDEIGQADPSSDPYESLLGSQTAKLLKKAIDTLPDREKMVLSLHHEEDMTFKDIAKILDLSEARICQLHGQSLSRIRSYLAQMN